MYGLSAINYLLLQKYVCKFYRMEVNHKVFAAVNTSDVCVVVIADITSVGSYCSESHSYASKQHLT